MIIVGGEMLVDLVGSMGHEHISENSNTPQGETPHQEKFSPLSPALGGGPFNVACTAGRMGAEVSFLTAMAKDHYGQAARRHLRHSGVGLQYIQDSSRPTSLAVAMIDPEGIAHYSFYMQGTADRYIQDPGPLPEAEIICLGTASLVLEPGAAVYENIMTREAQRGAIIALDPNIRPLLIDDPEAYRSRFQNWLQSVSILKVSDEDAQWLSPEQTPEEAVLSWLSVESAPIAVLLTRGGEGIDVYLRSDPHNPLHIEGIAVEVVDTIGAGDTVMGTVVAEVYEYLMEAKRQDRGKESRGEDEALHIPTPRILLENMSRSEWQMLVRRANYAASMTASRHGANPPTRAELEQRMREA